MIKEYVSAQSDTSRICLLKISITIAHRFHSSAATHSFLLRNIIPISVRF